MAINNSTPDVVNKQRFFIKRMYDVGNFYVPRSNDVTLLRFY